MTDKKKRSIIRKSTEVFWLKIPFGSAEDMLRFVEIAQDGGSIGEKYGVRQEAGCDRLPHKEQTFVVANKPGAEPRRWLILADAKAISEVES